MYGKKFSLVCALFQGPYYTADCLKMEPFFLETFRELRKSANHTMTKFKIDTSNL